MTKEAPDVIIHLECLGVLSSSLENNKSTQQAFDGHTHNCTCNEVTIYDEWDVMQLILEEGNSKGIIMYRIEDNRKLKIIPSKVVMFATRGLWTSIQYDL